MAFTAFLDESGTHQGSKALAVAGYVARSDQWATFEREWLAELARHGVPALHMSRFASGAPPYAGWSNAQRQHFIEALVSIINKNVVGGFGNVIPLKAYRSCVSGGAKSRYGGPYVLAAHMCAMDLAFILRTLDIRGRVAYVFESGAKGIGEIEKVFTSHVSREKDADFFRIASVRFEPKTGFVPLQAADLLAYELYREQTRRCGDEPDDMARATLNLLAGAPNRFRFVTEGELRMFSAVQEVGARPKQRKRGGRA